MLAFRVLVCLLICLSHQPAQAASVPTEAFQITHQTESAPQTQADAWDLSAIESQEIEALSQAPLTWSELDWRGQLLSHWHNKLVHFPLVLGLVAALLRWRHWYRPESPAHYAPFLLATAALSWVAALTGQQQAAPFVNGPLNSVLNLHQFLGIASTLGFAGLVWLDQQFSNRYILLQTLALSFWVSLLWGTGALGGLLGSSH